MAYMFVAEGIADPSITAVDSTHKIKRFYITQIIHEKMRITTFWNQYRCNVGL